MPQPRGEPGGQDRSDFARYAGLGVQFAATVVLLALGGYWLDLRAGTLPLFLLVGLLLGFLGATISLVRKVPPPRGGRRR